MSLKEELKYQKERKEKAIRLRKMHENRKIGSLNCSLKELHDFSTPELRARFNSEFVKIMKKER